MAAGIGTITSVTNSTTVTGSSTSFTLYQRVNGTLYNSGGTVIGIIASIASDTSLTLTANAAVAVTAASYIYTSPIILESGALSLPLGNTDNRVSALAGAIRYNSQRGGWEYSDGTDWLLPGQLVATGGTFSTAGGFNYHVFTSSGTLTVSAGTKSAELLLVAGGGGGGTQVGGGGGAGGLVYNSAFSLSPGTYTINIGGAGAASTSSSSSGGSGGNSTCTNATTAIGGGGGGSHSNNGVSTSGGSGGGGGGGVSGGTGGSAGTAGQGNPGGVGVTGNWSGGGGGGAGGSGQNAGTAGANIGGNGGVGLQYTQFAVAGSPAGWYAGGGGGCSNGSTVPVGAGGTGGGGSGHSDVTTAPNKNGIVNTGGGGGGIRDTPNPYLAGAGASGICIIRYAQ